MVHVALAAVEAEGVDAEVIDLRTLVPLDIEAIEESVEEDRPLPGRPRSDRAPPASAPSCRALVQERCFYHLEAPVERVTGWDTPYPHAYGMGLFPGPEAARRGRSRKVMED